MFSPLRIAAAALVSAVTFSAPVAAATVTESSDYSSVWNAPTQIAAGTTLISGSANSSDHDVFAINGLAAGAQTLSLTLSLVDRYVSGYLNAGGTIFYSAVPFIQNWDWTASTKLMDVAYNSGNGWSSGNLTSSQTINLGDTFAGGTLYLALAFTYGGNGVDYTIGVPANAPPAVPLPAGVVLMGTALLGLGGIAARRRNRG